MQAIEVLQEIRAERVREFNSYLESAANLEIPPELSEYFEKQQKLRKILLTLELPWKTDAVSLNEAYIKDNIDFLTGEPSEAYFEEWLNGSSSFDEKYKRQSLANLTANLGLKVLVDLVGHSMSFEEINLDHLDKIAPLKALKKAMMERGYEESTIKVYFSKLRTFLEFKRHPSNKSTPPLGTDNFLSLNSMAIIFDRLECKCIETQAKNDITRLVAARTLFYGGQRSIRALRLLKTDQIDNEKRVIKVCADATPIPVPRTFARLVGVSLSTGDHLVSFNEQRLHEWITLYAKKYGLSICPSTLKKGISATAEELGLDLEFLPRR